MTPLERTLATLPDAVDWPEPSESLAARVVSHIEFEKRGSDRCFRRWVWAAVGSLAVMIALIPGTRQAVGDLLQEAGVRIGFIEETPSDLGQDLQLGDRVTQQEAASLVEFDVRYPEVLGPPEETYSDLGLISMLWEGPILLTQRARGPAFGEKRIDQETSVMEVEVLDGPGLWVEGAGHSFTYLDANGDRIEETTRLAANVLLWSMDGVHYRLELADGLGRALEIAESLEVE